MVKILILDHFLVGLKGGLILCYLNENIESVLNYDNLNKTVIIK